MCRPDIGCVGAKFYYPNDIRAKRSVADAEAKFMSNKWGKLLDADLYYNPNLTLMHEDFSLGLGGCFATLAMTAVLMTFSQ